VATGQQRNSRCADRGFSTGASTKSLGNGVRLFNDSGSYRFRINGSFIDWHLKVKKLTPAEAAEYTPK
jgi:hypothetical protein